jgi:RNA polymerase sigma-70 factor, ECF subfamily
MLSSMPDEDLVGRAVRGDDDAFAELYDRYRQRVYATAYRIIQDREEALDACQEIFVKLHRSLDRWSARKSKFSTWLYRLAANHAIDCWRVRRRRAEAPLFEGEAEKGLRAGRLDGAFHSPYRELESRERVEVLKRCVDALPELQKKVFVLRFFQELQLEEIASMENCSLGTVNTSLFRATRTIRERLEKAASRRRSTGTMA